MWPQLGRTQRKQALLLGLSGLGLMLWAGLTSDAHIQYDHLLTQNLGLIVLLAAVTFLRLVSQPSGRGARVETGPGAFLRTLLGVQLFGAVINMSAVMIIGDRLSLRGRISDNTTRLLTRGFSSAAMWSPFFASMATALLYAPGARMTQIWLATLPLTAFALGFTYWQARRASPDRLRGFRGYPMRFSALWVPGVLVICVLIARGLWPEISVVGVVTTLAPLLALIILPLRRGPRRALRRSRQHVTGGLPLMRGELTLFLAAGVLAVGLFAVQEAAGLTLPFDEFDGWAACVTYGGMLLAAYVGVHAIVSIAVVAALAAPLSPEPNLLATMFLLAWANGAASSPFGGLTLSLQGRYGLTPGDILRWNGSYSVISYLAGCAGLLAMDALL
jgi:hypothetical protein